jgi:predicted house-cleaning NTP pyrophosphatase (Maf/HAM1 superfamily)
MRLILASQSPSRKRLLEGAGLHPEIIVSNVDEETDHLLLLVIPHLNLKVSHSVSQQRQKSQLNVQNV